MYVKVQMRFCSWLFRQVAQCDQAEFFQRWSEQLRRVPLPAIRRHAREFPAARERLATLCVEKNWYVPMSLCCAARFRLTQRAMSHAKKCAAGISRVAAMLLNGTRVAAAEAGSLERRPTSGLVKQRSDRVAVAFALDEGYAEQTGVTMTSILMNCSPRTRYHFYILDGGLSAKSKKRFEQVKKICECDIEFRNSAELAEKYDFAGYARKGGLPWVTAPVFHRLLLPSLLPEVERVLYLDGDLIVRKDLASLFHADLNGKYVGMASDVYARANLMPYDSYFRDRLGVADGDYFNAGVAVYDLTRMRREGVEKKLLDFLAARGPFRYNDQDLLNVVLKGGIYSLDQTWNMTQGCWNFDVSALPRSESRHIVACRADPSIVHYAGDAKPWNTFGGRYHIPFGDDYWR